MFPFLNRGPEQVKVCGQKYHVQEQLGNGRLAKVYRAIPEDLSVLEGLGSDVDSVTIKQFYPTALRNAPTYAYLRHAIRTRMADEFQDISPDVIPRILADGVDSSGMLVLSHTPGEALQYPDEDCPYELGDVLELKGLIRGLYERICALMENELVHRDVKPDNMLVSDAVRLIDIDLLSRVGEKASEVPFGTRKYSAPEQLRGAAPRLTNDVFPAGVIIGHLMGERASKALRLPSWGTAGQMRLIHGSTPIDYVGGNEAGLLNCYRSYPDAAQAEAFGILQLMRASLHLDPKDRPSNFATVEQILDSKPNIA